MKHKLLLIGGGGHCRSCIDVIENNGQFDIAGIIDRQGTDILGYPVIGTDDNLAELRKEYEYALITVGQVHNLKLRMAIYHKLSVNGFFMPTIISPTAHVAESAKVLHGTIVMHHAIVNAGSKVGTNCIINSKSLIEHDASVGMHTHVSTGAVVNGGAKIGNNCFIGSNATVVHGIKVPSFSFVKAGSLWKETNQ